MNDVQVLQEPLIREITEEVVRLTTKYGGLLWGEHGKGVRSDGYPFSRWTFAAERWLEDLRASVEAKEAGYWSSPSPKR